MTLVILAHPDSAHSIANRAVIEGLQSSDLDLEIRDIGKLYPDLKVDVLAEQAALLRHHFVIFQHPMYWFNIPAILKAWMDQVWSYQFAYGERGDKLKGKQLLQSLTIGQDVERMSPKLARLSSSIEESAKYCQMNFVGTFPLYDIATITGNTPEIIRRKSQEHSLKIYNVIKKLALTEVNHDHQ